jgi:S1-C subfamily serine protease
MARQAPLLTLDEPDGTALVERPRPSWRRPPRAWLAALLVVLVLAVAFWRFSDDAPAPLSRRDVDRSVQAGIEKARNEARNAPPDAAAAYRRIAPSLVTIVTARKGARATTESALGTGVIANAQGNILTALHVVQGGEPIQVRFADGTQATGRIENQQPATDIAVLSVDRLPEVVVPAVLGGGAEVGDAVFPVGNPLGLQGTLTAGVVSALERSIRTEGGGTLKGLIQFDAAVNPGNSGGPLLDRNGQVIGIVTGLANPSQQPFFVGIGFAVPIATAGGVAGGPSK